MKSITTLISENRTLFDALYESHDKDKELYVFLGKPENPRIDAPAYWPIPKCIKEQLANYSIDPKGFDGLLLNCCHSRNIEIVDGHRKFMSLNELQKKNKEAFASDKELQGFIKQYPEECYITRIVVPPSVKQYMDMGCSYEQAFNAVTQYVIEHVGKHKVPMKGLCTSTPTMISVEKLFIDPKEWDLDRRQGKLLRLTNCLFERFDKKHPNWKNEGKKMAEKNIAVLYSEVQSEYPNVKPTALALIINIITQGELRESNRSKTD